MTRSHEAGASPPILLKHRLLIAREFAGLEQSQLAELIGVARNTISNAERGVVKPRKITLNAWAHVCNVDRDWLEHGSQPTDWELLKAA